jgi:hypothetical protein
MPPHGYIHVLSLTENITEFEKAVHRQKISGNIDTPEGGFDAMLQAAVCEVSSFSCWVPECSDVAEGARVLCSS